MEKFLVTAAPFPSTSLLNATLNKMDYNDSFTGIFMATNQLKIEDCAYAFFDTAPAWISRLLYLRNKLVKIFGLKTSINGSRAEFRKSLKIETGNSLGLFKILHKSKNEVIMGEDDKHLNFRVSLVLNKLDTLNTYQLTISTTVKMNNWVGKLYFLPVQPIHKIIVPVMLRGIMRHLQKPAAE